MSSEELPRLGRYQVQAKLAQGGMAEIFLAKALGVMGFERLVAIKLIHSQLTRDQEFVKMFIDEARISMHLHHRNIVQVFDLDRAGDTYFIAMEYVHGVNLYDLYERLAARARWFDLPLALYLVSEVAKGLHFAHTRSGPDGRPLGIIHRDISPQNVLLSFEGEVKITDFGIAKAAERLHNTMPGIVKGKYAYMAPEILREQPVDARADVFACGVLLYELLMAENPFAGATPIATIENVLQKRVAPPTERGAVVSRDLDDIVMRALDKDPTRRFQTAAQLSEALTEYGLNLTTARREIASGDSTLAALLAELFPEKAKRPSVQQRASDLKLPLAEPSRDTQPEVSRKREDRSTDPNAADTRPPLVATQSRIALNDEPSTALDLDPSEAYAVDRTGPVRMEEPATDRSLPAILDSPPSVPDPVVASTDGADDTILNGGRELGAAVHAAARSAQEVLVVPVPAHPSAPSPAAYAGSKSNPGVQGGPTSNAAVSRAGPATHPSSGGGGPAAQSLGGAYGGPSPGYPPLGHVPQGYAQPGYALQGLAHPAQGLGAQGAYVPSGVHSAPSAGPGASMSPMPSPASGPRVPTPRAGAGRLAWLGLGLAVVAAAVVGAFAMSDRSGGAVVPVPIFSQPPGATVRVDGVALADATPVEAMLVAGTSHVVEVTQRGHRPFRVELMPMAGVAARVDAKLEAITGRIRLDVEPKDAQVFVNGVARGTAASDLVDLVVGQDVAIRLERAGFGDYQTTVSLSESQPEATVTARLTQLP
jgi:serine/threonine protein kinase